MLEIDPSTQPSEPPFVPTLADLSRNASVISSSSDSESNPSILLKTPRPRPTRTFSSPRSRSPHSSTSQSVRPPPAYLTRELGLTDENRDVVPETVSRVAQARSKSRKRSGSRNPSANTRISAQDFIFAETLGEGSYSTVMRARYARTGQEYAIKILDKNHLIRKEKMPVALAEKNTLVKLGAGHPGIIHLHSTFQDDWSLFFVLDLAKNGEMQTRISRLGSLSLACARYYTAQIVDALDYMHSKDVVHRDLKPENLLLDSDFRIKITDFGTGKILEGADERAHTFVGTAQYVSPELLERNETSKSSDLWALGCIVYQMIAGRFAFQGLSEYLTWQKIKSLDYTFPDGFDDDGKDFVQGLLVRDPLQRLGAGPPGSAYDRHALRTHPFLAPINWETLWTDPAPPLEPGLVKKEHPTDGDKQWEDVGETWDAVVGGPVQRIEEGDELGWALDGEGTEFERYKVENAQLLRGGDDGTFERSEEVGPMGERPDYARTEEDAKTVIDEKQLLSVPISLPPNATGTGSGTSSSDGSLVDKAGLALAAMELNRGRNRALTPVQGNGTRRDASWSSLLLPGESVIFNSRVEARSPKRRGSRLRLPISVSPIRPKTRQLLLTTHRLLCVKQRPDASVTLKTELNLRRPAEKGKEKDKESRCVVESAERKGEREFVVLTSTQSQTYAAETGSISARWVEKINASLSTQSSPPQKH
ncbi:kinase-like protein [Phlebopus sp. FC_14]|nr:kinase-like protein [Phlebopus sp. FC_14]